MALNVISDLKIRRLEGQDGNGNGRRKLSRISSFRQRQKAGVKAGDVNNLSFVESYSQKL